ncbi:MAG: TraB/GumN family protein [Erythrobacter sp.]
MKTPYKFLASAVAASAALLATPTLAQTQSTPTPVPHTQIPIQQDQAERVGPALWRVDDEDTTVYLFGTVHALPQELEWLNPTISDALASSESLVTEITMNDSMAADMQRLVMEKGILPQGTTLRSKLDAEQTIAYETALSKIGLPTAAFDQFEPWYAGMMMSMLPLLQQGYSPESGVEKVLLGQSGTLRRSSLETLDFQLSLFDELPEESQIAFLIEASKNVDLIKGQLDAMVAEWVEGDADGLAKLMNEGLSDETLADELLYTRNRNWANWIKGRMEAPGTVFIAVGAGHLAGEESVQDALKVLGIATTRVQ